jgi:uncharacterized membrane protein YtjA (UPF0391 family)
LAIHPSTLSANTKPLIVIIFTLHTGNQPAASHCRGTQMLYYALVFLVIAIVAALLGFGGAAVAFAGIAKILFILFLVLFLVSLIMHLGRRV